MTLGLAAAAIRFASAADDSPVAFRMQFLATFDSYEIEDAYFNIGCAGVTIRQELPHVNSWQTTNTQIAWQDPNEAYSLTTFCGTDVGLMQSFTFHLTDHTDDGLLIAHNLCQGMGYFVLSYVVVCNCDDRTGRG